MDCLELNIHQRILSDIASNVGDSVEDIAFAESLIIPNVQTRVVDENTSTVNGDAELEDTRVFMPVSRVHCNIAFGELVVNFSDQHISENIDTLIPVLLDLLRDVPHIDFDKSLAWDDWSLPDKLVFSTVSALLRLVYSHSQYTDRMVNGIATFVEDISNSVRKGAALNVLVQFAPALHGLYRAICSTPFPWTTAQWKGITRSFLSVCAVETVDRLNGVLVEIAQQHNAESTDSSLFAQSFLARYVSRGNPLSGYFMVCCMLEANRTILSSVLTAPHNINYHQISDGLSANNAWTSLTRQEALVIEVEDKDTTKALKEVVTYAMQCFTDLFVQVEGMESKLSADIFVWETMSESLKLAAVASVTLRELDEQLYERLLSLLNQDSPISENMVQEAALQTITVLVRCFPDVAPQMSGHLRRFVTLPLVVFESDQVEAGKPRPLHAAAKCLALCIKLSPGDDLVLSNMYSMLNYIAATSKELHDNSSMSQLGHSFVGSSNDSTADSMAVGLRGLSEDDKRRVGISTISVVTRLALEFDMDEVTKLTVSMLLQRLQTAEPTVEAAIASNLVDLALAAPESAFVDIIRAFSVINRSADPEDPRSSNNMVLAAQTRLAQDLSRRPEFYETYLVELLTLFADKAVAIQNVKMSNSRVSTTSMVDQLASLLLPIDALLAHVNFNPHVNSSTTLVSLFRNLWFLCALFHLTSEDGTQDTTMDWRRPALARIASKTPAIVIEESHDSVASDVEYNSVIRQDYAGTVISMHRATLTKHISIRTSDIRYLSSGQVVFLLAMHDMETMRSAQGLTSSLVTYFVNDSLNRNAGLTSCMEAIAEKVIRGCNHALNSQASRQALPSRLFTELKNLLVASTHRVEKARDVALKFLDRLITSFPSLMCDPSLVYSVLEVLTLLRRACENEFTDEYNPIFEFHSPRADITLQLTDNFAVRNKILTELHKSATAWFASALARAPLELQSTLQKYLAMGHSSVHEEGSELGASLAEKFAKSIGPGQRKLTSLTDLSAGKMDKSRSLFTQITSKGYFHGEVSGIRLANQLGVEETLEKSAPKELTLKELENLKQSLAHALHDIHDKTGSLTILELKRLLFRCAATLVSSEKCDYDLIHYLVALPFEASTPVAIANGIEAWTWVIAEKPHMEIALMGEILSAWSDTIDQAKGIFSSSLNYSDPFVHPVSYSPSDREEIEREASLARRLLAPLGLVLQMLLSRMQAARYRRPGVMFMIQHLILRSATAHKSLSTHSLSRESRFSFLLFGLETLKSSHLDIICDARLREGLYSAAYSWFSVSPQWTYGANRVQLDADIKVLSEFLAYLQIDSAKRAYAITSLSQSQSSNSQIHHATRLQRMSAPLKLLVENEIYRLSVWTNPTNDPKRGTDQLGSFERSTTDSFLWPDVIRATWNIDPAIAVFLTERFKNLAVKSEVTKYVRSFPTDVLRIPEALPLFVGEKSDGGGRRDLKYMLLWAPLPPILATNFFGQQYETEPIVLQYAHRVMEQHPIDLTFFFVPQVVQALRYDKLGYVSRFIFETAKISQHFCHQIIWNMKANCFRGDEGVEEDPMKPELDKMIDQVVRSLSGEARDFYDREFGFFHEVTSISGKLKPFITKTKPEKKAKIDEEMAKLVVDVGVYLPSNPDGVVVDIDKKSGRPLQSHAKAPFMATFKVRKEKVIVDANPDSLVDDDTGNERRSEYDVWQQAIFKVGDDCRQDVLALQIIAMFKNIFTAVGLPLYLYPYRVTATAPGCGVIDVVPNATSRDEMGRAKVNDLMDFFVAKYGGEDTVAFQEARLKFIQSMAAYSVACYILQIKDRHNGNIMIDGEGHIVHIADILSVYLRPGGVKFEPSSFKLNHEMVVLMGGRYSQGYQLFQHLTVKAFLAIRPYTEQLVSTVQLMLGTELPSFKGEGTITRLRDRFAPGVNERQAADFMMGVIKNAHENMRSTVYDEFQRIQNGIPYK